MVIIDDLENIEFQNLASKDHLTGLYNRSKLDEKLEYQLKNVKRTNRVFGLILVDIDFFKFVNDEHGHQVGDEVLCEFASLLTRTLREIDFIGRWGGEEFLIIVEDATQDSLQSFAEKLRESVALNIFPVIIHKTASFGITLYQEQDTPSSLIARVDAALYEAKHQERNRVYFLS